VAAAIAALGCAPEPPRDAGSRDAPGALLSTLAVDRAPYLHLEANSEQRQPVYFGARPRDIVLGLPPPPSGVRPLGGPAIPRRLAALGEAQIAEVAGAARARAASWPRARVEIEMWPVRDDDGRLTWALARYRAPGGSWGWIDAAWIPPRGGDDLGPMLPIARDARRRDDARAVFDDPLSFDSLYQKPVFGDCVWTRGDGGTAIAAWLPLARAKAVRDAIANGSYAGDSCRVIGQVARWNGAPFALVVGYEPERRGVTWPAGLVWVDDDAAAGALPDAEDARIASWPEGFDARYRADVLALDGEAEAVFPKSGARVRFTRKESADPANQLERVADYLEERYAALGIATRRDRFSWRGVAQSNVIAKIPGVKPGAGERPVILADHVDTAFAEAELAARHRRVAAPGADDNATGTAALLRAAEVLRDRAPARDIWLVHLTGEEFPGDDLGARRFVSDLLRSRQDVAGVVLLDMIGYRTDRAEGARLLFQVNAGEGAAAAAIAETALVASRTAAPALVPALRSRFDPRSYLYNTDGLVFSDAGYPVVLLNEHINRLEHLDRPHYHEMTDTAETLDFGYAASIARVAIELTARLAGVPSESVSRAPIAADVIAVPAVRQKTPYSCGDAATLGVLRFWKAAEFDAVDESALYAPLGTTPDDGTDPAPIARTIDAVRGLSAEYRQKTAKTDVAIADVERAIDRGEPPIVDIQAWRDPKDGAPAPWSDDWDDGHYVVAIGYDDARLYFMDPSEDSGYGYIEKREFATRWHDVEGKANTHVDHMTIFVRPRASPSPSPAPPRRRVTAVRMP